MCNRIFISHEYKYLYIIYTFHIICTNIEHRYKYKTIHTRTNNSSYKFSYRIIDQHKRNELGVQSSYLVSDKGDTKGLLITS